jgi:hypothetical protein
MTQAFPVPTEDQLENLGAGCFVRIVDQSDCFWVEIDGEDSGMLTGMVHPELATNDCTTSRTTKERIYFRREQVKFVGCDRYCFC